MENRIQDFITPGPKSLEGRHHQSETNKEKESSITMKEILTCNIWTGIKIKVVIDRETGEFVLFNSRFRLEIRGDQAFLMDRYGENPLFTGHLYGNCWFFEGHDCIREDEDPFAAAVQFL